MQQLIEQFSQTVREAGRNQRPLRIQGSGSKSFYGRAVQGDALDVTPYRGIVSYEPTELVLTARAGTPLAEIEAALGPGGKCCHSSRRISARARRSAAASPRDCRVRAAPMPVRYATTCWAYA